MMACLQDQGHTTTRMGAYKPRTNPYSFQGHGADCLPYVFERGFLALDGCSLTVATLDREARTATVHLIPETLQRTTFGTKGVGDLVNVEVDRNTQVIVDTVVRVLGEMAREGGGAAAGLAGLSSWGTRE